MSGLRFLRSAEKYRIEPKYECIIIVLCYSDLVINIDLINKMDDGTQIR